MAKTRLQRLISPIRGAIDRAFTGGAIPEKKRNSLYKSLVYLLMGEPHILPDLRDFCLKAKREKSLVNLFLSLGTRIKLPQAIYARIAESASMTQVLKSWRITKGDIRLVNQIIRQAEINPYDEHHLLLRRHYSRSDFDWLAEVELRHESLEVVIQNQALEDMLLGAFETYRVPKSKKEPFSEVFGLVLGMTTSARSIKRGEGTHTRNFVHVEKAVPQIRAKSSSSSVTPSAHSLNALVEASGSLFPQLEIIGDYHSHPYRNYLELKKMKGWYASHEDAVSSASLSRDLVARKDRPHHMKVSLVIAIAEGRGNAIPEEMKDKKNLHHLKIGGCHVIVTAYRILSNGVMTTHNLVLRLPYQLRKAA